MDLRTYLDSLASGLTTVERRLSPRWEVPALLQKLEDQGRFPVLLCPDVLDARGEASAFALVANLFADRGRLAEVLGCAVRQMAETYAEKAGKRVPVKVTEAAPVKENRLLGEEVDLFRLPAVTHHEKDAGPYLTSGVVVVKDPETGIVNAAIQRLQLKARDRLGLFMVPGGHNHLIYEKYRRLGRNTPVAIVLGHHPAFFLGVQFKGELDDDEYEVVGSLLGAPLEVTPGLTCPELPIPARAEIVLEGEIVCSRLEAEGPFGEYSHYYSPQRQSNVVEVKALLHREGAIFHDIFACHPDHHYLEGLVMESQLLTAARRRHPGVQSLCLPPSGCCQFYCYVSLEKKDDAEPRQLAETLLATTEYVKYVVVVDPDVDVFHEAQVLWALATRARVPDSFHLLAHLKGTAMDPSAAGQAPPRAAVDATRSAAGPHPEPTRLPHELLARLDLADYGL